MVPRPMVPRFKEYPWTQPYLEQEAASLYTRNNRGWSNNRSGMVWICWKQSESSQQTTRSPPQPQSSPLETKLTYPPLYVMFFIFSLGPLNLDDISGWYKKKLKKKHEIFLLLQIQIKSHQRHEHLRGAVRKSCLDVLQDPESAPWYLCFCSEWLSLWCS